MGIVPISQGDVSSTVVDSKLIFASALKVRAYGIILGHNHPSGNLTYNTFDFEINISCHSIAFYHNIFFNIL